MLLLRSNFKSYIHFQLAYIFANIDRLGKPLLPSKCKLYCFLLADLHFAFAPLNVNGDGQVFFS